MREDRGTPLAPGPLVVRTALAAALLTLGLVRFAAAGTGEAEEGPCFETSLTETSVAMVATDAALSDEGAEVAAHEPGMPSKPGDVLKMALDDAVHVLSAPIHWNLNQWMLAAASIGTVAALGELGDVHLRAAVLKNKSGVLDDLTKVVEPFGTEYGWAVVGAYGIVGFVFKDTDSQNIAFDAAMAGLLSGGITDGLKVIVGRARPYQEQGAASFDPFGGDKSFPSGHATTAFAIGSVIAAHSDQAWVKISAYSIASLVAFSRVYHDAHWSSDVAAGALIGTVVGETVVRFNNGLRAKGSKVSAFATPIYGTDGRRGAALVVVF
jgi:membrane-associated phospholipid phosphatase